MNQNIVWAIVGGVIVAVIGVLFLYLGSTGAMPTAFGLFDMNNLGVRAVVTIILIDRQVAGSRRCFTSAPA